MMLQSRDLHHAYLEERKLAMYVICDASQIAGRNLMMTEYVCIPGSKILGAAEAANAMKALPQTEPFSHDTWEITQVSTAQIPQALVHHILPPVTLAQRHSTLSHRLHGFIHQWR
jgi:hypothetical protein